MPLPLYGSGGRSDADLAATSPTACLSMPRTSTTGGLRRLELDALGRLDDDRVAEADEQLEVGALDAGAVADADDLETLLEAVGDALTMLAMSVRVRPCSDRCGALSVGRVTVITPSSSSTDHLARHALRELALGALDRHHAVVVANSTPAGTAMGALPIRDMSSSLPDEADDLAAEAEALRLGAGHETA